MLVIALVVIVCDGTRAMPASISPTAHRPSYRLSLVRSPCSALQVQHQSGGFDLIYHNGSMVLDPASAYSTFLGTDLPRPQVRISGHALQSIEPLDTRVGDSGTHCSQ
jgi:hypothetical protein